MLVAVGWVVGIVVAAAGAAFATAEFGGAMLEVIDSGSQQNQALRDADTISDPSGDAAYQRIQEAHRNGHQRQAVAIYSATRSVVKEVVVGRLDEKFQESVSRIRPSGDGSPVGFGEVDLAGDVWDATHPDNPDGDASAGSSGPGTGSSGSSGSGSAGQPPAAATTIVFRGQVELGDPKLAADLSGLIMIENEVIIRAPKAGGRIEGTLVLEWRGFPIGEFVTGLASGIADGIFPGVPTNPTERETFLASCKSNIRIEGPFEGEFDAGISKLLGTITYRTDFLKDMTCNGPLPKEFKDAAAAQVLTTTTTWQALYDGVRNVSGAVASADSKQPPDQFRFRLTASQ